MDLLEAIKIWEKENFLKGMLFSLLITLLISVLVVSGSGENKNNSEVDGNFQISEGIDNNISMENQVSEGSSKIIKIK